MPWHIPCYLARRIFTLHSAFDVGESDGGAKPARATCCNVLMRALEVAPSLHLRNHIIPLRIHDVYKNHSFYYFPQLPIILPLFTARTQ